MAAAAAAAADSFVRFCTDLFSTVLKCIREREGKEGAARARAPGGKMTTLFLPREFKSPKLDLEEGEKKGNP